MENKQLRQEIMSRYINRVDSDDGVNIFFNYQQAMQEYADLLTAQLNQTVEELRKEVERLKGLLERAYENGRLYAQNDVDGLTWDGFKEAHNI